MPKGKRQSNIHSRLKKQSPWFTSINDPLGGADCKIPDETGVETGTLQLVQRATFTAGTAGVGGMRMLTPYINSVSNPTLGSIGRNYQQVDPVSTSSTILWGAETAVFVPDEGYAFDGVDELQQITEAHRIVSAGIYVQPETSLANNKGEYTLFVTPFQVDNSPFYENYMNKYKSVVVPLNSNKAGTCKWFPFALEDLSFKNFFRTTGTQFDDVVNTDKMVPYWGIGAICDGCEPGAIFRITFVVNYEFVPVFNTLNIIDASPSPQDATEVDLVENWVQEMPVATLESQTKASTSPSSVSPQHGENDSGTGFGMFFNVIAELAPLALALL